MKVVHYQAGYLTLWIADIEICGSLFSLVLILELHYLA
jgi:hypothetical protein